MAAVGETLISFHGVRGSAPVSGVSYDEFGGDTPSIEIAADDSRLFIDAGSGLRNAQATPDLPDEIDLVLSHYHYDHLIGLPFFQPAWRPHGRLRIWAPKLESRAPFDSLETLFSPPFCPIGLDDFRTRVEVRSFAPGDCWAIGADILVSTMLADHPGGCAAIRLSMPGGDVVYASDCELSDAASAAQLSDFSRDCDLLIVDAMNGDTNAAARRGWGHSSWREALFVAADADARRVALFHHDPAQTDDALRALEADAAAIEPRAFSARQGLQYRLATSAAGAVAPTMSRKGENAPWRCSR